MSTCYSTLKSPVTHIAVEPDGQEHSRVLLSVNGLVAGFLLVPEADVSDFIRLFFTGAEVVVTSSGVHAVAHTLHWRDDVVLLSEYGELTTWGAIKENTSNETRPHS